MYRKSVSLFVTALSSVVLLGTTNPTYADSDSASVLVLSTRGQAEYRYLGQQWMPLQSGTTLDAGASIRTSEGGSVNFVLKASGTALRLPETSELNFELLKAREVGPELVTDTRLRLISGTVIGSQKKLSRPSLFEIYTPEGKATITGTEYVVRDDGAVSVLSGSVSMHYNLPGNGGSVKVNVLPGQSFNPATGEVVSTTPDYLKDLIAEVDTVKHNAEVYKAGGATVVVKPDQFVSPTKGNNGVGNGVDPQPPGNPPINDGPGTSPGNPGNKGGAKK